MNSYDKKSKKRESQSAANSTSHNKNATAATLQLVDNRPEAITQLKLQEMTNKSSGDTQVGQLKAINESTSTKQQQPIQMAKGKGGGKKGRQPGSKGDRSDRGKGRAAHSYEAIFANGTTATFQAGNHGSASRIAGAIATRRGTTVSDVNQKS